MVVVALQHLGSLDGHQAPVHLNVVLAHVAGLPGRVDKPGTDFAAPPEAVATVPQPRLNSGVQWGTV